MHDATDCNPGRQVQPRGLGARPGSTRSGHNEPALLGQLELRRGSGSVPTALPQNRPMAGMSLVSSGCDYGHCLIHVQRREVFHSG
jgi:hypothetical protein